MAKRVIALMGTPIINEEDKAVEAITPGHLLMHNGTTGLQRNTANAANVARMFALERDELGSGISVAYASGDTVKTGSFHQGQRVYALIPSGQNIAKGAYLTTDNAGRLTATGVTTALRVAVATAAADNSAGPTDMRISVEIV